jgi:hypothetical protein
MSRAGKAEGTMHGLAFNIAAALCSVAALGIGFATSQEVLIALGAVGLGGWAARLRWGPRS